jgi:hypothetical protein
MNENRVTDCSDLCQATTFLPYLTFFTYLTFRYRIIRTDILHFINGVIGFDLMGSVFLLRFFLKIRFL